MGNALVPELAVTDFASSMAFYCDVLGFACAYRRPEEGFAYLRLGAAELMIDQIGVGRTFDDGHLPEAYPFGKGLNLQIEVADIAPLAAGLDAAGHDLYLQPEDRWYRRNDEEIGHRQFVVADPDGYLLRFVKSLGTRPVRAADGPASLPPNRRPHGGSSRPMPFQRTVSARRSFRHARVASRSDATEQADADDRMMRFVNPLPFVADMDRSKRFYAEVLGLRIREDWGDFVKFDGGFALHDGASLHQTVFGTALEKGGPFGRRNLVLYFEAEDIDAAFARIAGRVDLIHGVRRQRWGQRVFRFFDPDHHLVEIGEPQ